MHGGLGNQAGGRFSSDLFGSEQGTQNMGSFLLSQVRLYVSLFVVINLDRFFSFNFESVQPALNWLVDPLLIWVRHSSDPQLLDKD